MKLRIRSLRWKLVLQVLGVVAVALVALTFVAIQTSTSAQKDSVYRETANLARSQANAFDARAQRGQALGQTIATLSDGDTIHDRANTSRMLRAMLERTPEVLGTYVGYEPNAFDGADATHRSADAGHDKTGQFLPYWSRIGGPINVTPLADWQTSDYWQLPKKTLKNSVIEPYLYNGALMTSYTSPILRGGKFVGIGGVDVALAALDKDVSAVKVLKTGYAFYVSNTGIFVSAPDKKLIGKQTLGKFAKDKKSTALEGVAADVKAGRGGRVETKDPFTGKDVVMFWAPVKTGHWALVTVAPKDEIFAAVNAQRNKLILIGLLALIGIGGAVLFVATRFSKPIVEVSEAAGKIAHGDLDVSVVARSDDELGRLANSFGQMVEYLRDKATIAEAMADGDLTNDVEPHTEKDVLGNAFKRMTGQLRTLVGSIGTTAGDVTTASQQMASTSAETGRAVGEIANAIGDVAAGAERQVRTVAGAQRLSAEVVEVTQSSAEEARATVDAAGEARVAAEQGVQAVEQLIEAMRNVRESSQSATGAIRDLGTKSEQIGGIVETITGIAGQTNLLALNAAIEAARAGEQGRGFAVVAEEVRKLAEESQRAASTIATLIGEIQTETGHAVEVVEDGARRTEEGTETVEQAREAFVGIGDSVRGMSERVEGIALSIDRIAEAAQRMQADMSEVAAVAEESSASTEQVSASTQQTSASTDEIAASAQQLAVNASDLEELVRRFRVEA
jgi:methyl-accepting chemotaxis protein